jgi:hypothetical protein
MKAADMGRLMRAALEVKKKGDSKMKKMVALMAALVLVTLLGSFAQAEQCYNLVPFSDVIHLSHLSSGPNQTLFGNWISSDYTLPVVGAREANLGGGPNRVSLNGTNNTSDFGGNQTCSLDGTINGPWAVACVGVNATFTVTGSAFAPVSCTAARREGNEAGKAGK